MSKFKDDQDAGDEVIPPANAVSYKSKLVGVTFEGRQDIIKMLKGDEPLRVRREADNQYDPQAVAVDVLIAEVYQPIGYIAKDKNKDISAALDAGEEVSIAIASLTGGGDKSVGVNISLEYVKVKEEAKKAEPAVETVQPEPTAWEKLQEALKGYADELAGKKREKYTSRLLGKTTEVVVTNGHMTIPGYMSGSAFPKKFYPEFDEKGILDAMLKKHYPDAKAEDVERIRQSILSMWGLNRDASTGYGTAIHAALENFITYQALGHKLRTVKTFKTKDTEYGPNKALSRNPFLSKIVSDFWDKFGSDHIRLTEQFVWLHGKNLCGSIDLIKVIDAKKKVVRIQDFKTDGDVHEKTYQISESPFKTKMGNELLDLHWLQLSFYAYILMQYGYTVEGLDVYWLNPEKLVKGENAWEEFSSDVIDISGEV